MKIETNPIFDYYPPSKKFIGVLSIPHSGMDLPEEFTPYLSNNSKDLAQDVDWKVHELIDIGAIQKAGIAVIKAHIIRTAVDLNRSRELALLNWKKNSKGIEVVLKDPDEATAQRLLGKYYDPYYEMMRTLMEELKNYTKVPNFVDLHSMPSKAEEYHLKINPNQPIERPDFCLSDQHGKTCEEAYIKFFQTELMKGYKNVAINSPYVGGHITQHVGKHWPEGNNIQIEISRGIYMNEEVKALNSEQVEYLKPRLTEAIINGFETQFRA